MGLLIFLLIAAVIFIINSLQMKRSAARDCRAVLDRLLLDRAALAQSEDIPRRDEVEKLLAEAAAAYNRAAAEFNGAIRRFPGSAFCRIIHAEPFALYEEKEGKFL